MTRQRWEFTAVILLVLCILMPRLPALDSFATVDESSWLMRSANFFYALGQRDFEKTVYAYHPAVTTMWMGAAAMAIDFPEYRGLGQGYFEKEWQFSDFLISQDYHPREMLKTSRQITVGINAVLLIAIYFLLRRLFDWFAAFVAVIFLSFEPFLLGHTRILAHEGMLSLLVLFSILAFLIFLYQGNQRLFLILSGIAAGLAILTKSSATILLPFVGMLILLKGLNGVHKTKNLRIRNIWNQFKAFVAAYLIWMAVLAVTFFIFWPGMWVAPGKMLHEVYGNALSYVFFGYNLEAAERMEPGETAEATLASASEFGFAKYANDIPWHTTVTTWIGLLLAIGLVFSQKSHLPPTARQVIFTLGALALLFYTMMAVAQGRQTTHYILTTYACLSLISGLGIGFSLQRGFRELSGSRRIIVPGLAFLVLLAIQIASALHFYPYYFNYQNPVLRALREETEIPVGGYGEGLELAADYLAQKPGAENLTVLSWYGIGPFSYFFPGKTENLFPSVEWSPGLIERLAVSDYLVIYQNHQQQRGMPAKLLQILAKIKPEHTIWLNGIEIVRIYPVDKLPNAVFIPDLTEKHE